MGTRGGGVGACVPWGAATGLHRGGGCPAPLKMKEERKGNDLSGALGWRCSCSVELAPTGLMAALMGYRLCEGEARWTGRS